MKLVKAALAVMALCGLGYGQAHALELYVDTKTKQLFAEPGNGRVRLGTFEQVQEAGQEPKASRRGKRSIEAIEANMDKKSVELKELEASIDKKKDDMKAIERKVEQVAARTPRGSSDPVKPSSWFDKINIRGYTQFRYTQPLSNRYELASPGDRSISENQDFLIRRARLIIFGDITDHLSIYLQPDFASGLNLGGGATTSTGNFAQLRDWYADIFFDKQKEFRIRAGQSKIPYGFEILQSSQNRLAFDRADAVNTAARDERDVGLFFYWAPSEIRETFKYLVKSGLKGSGDYGVVGFGAYNGQGANRFELNDQVHLIGRFSYPYKFSNGQIFEGGVSGYSGRFLPGTGTGFSQNLRNNSRPFNATTNPIIAPTLDNYKGLQDERIGLHAVLYPQPFGLQAEWNWGVTPQISNNYKTITSASLNGGYVQAMYKFDHFYGTWIPYAKWQYYRGAEKFANNAPYVRLNEVEAGIEWQPLPELELTMAYSNMNRTNVANLYQANGNLLRMQLQWNY